MLPATIFRQLYRRPGPNLCSLTELLQHGAVTNGSSANAGANGVINCLNRYAAATGFIRISFLDINRCRSWDVATWRMYADTKKQSLHMRTLKGRHLIQDAIDKKRESFIERKNVIVEDIREARSKVQERVRVKMEEVIERENILTIPNVLTVGRAVLSPYIGYIIVQGDFSLAMGLLVVAGISDLVRNLKYRRIFVKLPQAGKGFLEK